MTILVVDDSKTMRALITRALKQAGFGEHTIVQAGNGLEGLQAAADSSPDLIISDWSMPKMNGLQFLRKLREGGNNTTFGFITTEKTTEMHEMAHESGAAFFVEKPFSTEEIECVLSPVLL